MSSYDWIKIAHVLTASLAIASMAYCIKIWRSPLAPTDKCLKILSINLYFISPLLLIQLLTGFSMFSLNHNGLNEVWVPGSVCSFIAYILSWMGFIYFCSAELQSPTKALRYYQWFTLGLCAFSLFAMIFFMSNKITTWAG